MKQEKFCVIGCGGLGSALVKGIARNHQNASVAVVDRNPQKVSLVEKELGQSLESASTFHEIKNADVVVLAVKPHATAALLKAAAQHFDSDTLYVSVAAGVSLDVLQKAAPGASIARAMPNIGSSVGAGTTAVLLGDACLAQRDQRRLEDVFKVAGSLRFLDDEKQFHAVTALSGSGPAFVLLMLETMEDAGVKCGLKRENAAFFAAGALEAALALSRETDCGPGALRAQITSPGGTTIAGLAALDRGGFRAAILDAVDSAESRSRSMESENT